MPVQAALGRGIVTEPCLSTIVEVSHNQFCGICGTCRAELDRFCGQCGAFLAAQVVGSQADSPTMAMKPRRRLQCRDRRNPWKFKGASYDRRNS